MEKNTFHIPNISCGHCVHTIKNEMEELEGVLKVEGDIDKKEITIDWESPATLQAIKDTLKEINYPPDN